MIPLQMQWVNYLDGAGQSIASSNGQTITCSDTHVSYPVALSCPLPMNRCKDISEFPAKP
jgi:hypothetical protein